MNNCEDIIYVDEFIGMPSIADAESDLDEIAENSSNISHAVDNYLKRIGQVPLLKPEEEKELFEELQSQTTLLEDILNKLQHSNLLDSEQQEQLRQVFCLKRQRTEDVQMKLSPESLAGLQDLIADWQSDAALEIWHKQDWYFSVPRSKTEVIVNTSYGENHNGRSKLFSQTLEFEDVLTEFKAVVERIRDIQQCLVEANLLLVASIAKQFAFRDYPLSFLDLMQEGSIGLMKAIYKFRLEKGHRFSTYATWWISQAMRRAIDEQSQLIRVPTYVIEERRRTDRVSIDLMKSLGREPQINELAEAVNTTRSKLYNLLQTPKDLLSLDSPIGESEDRSTVADLIRDEMTISPEEEILSQGRQEIMENLLSTLSAQQARVIKLRYGLFDGQDHTLAQIGAKLHISRERVRQIELEALNKLRHPNRRHYWEELFD